MARLFSDVKGGAYPLEEDKYVPLANLVKPYGSSSVHGKLLDPFINTGDAAGYLAKQWNMELYGIENQKQYVDLAIEKYGYENILYEDAYEARISKLSFDVIYLNPPYNIDEASGEITSTFPGQRFRSEERALKYFWNYLQPNGVMILVMYAHNLNKQIYQSLLTRATDIFIYRFPGLHLGRYTQIAIFAYKDKDKKEYDNNRIEEGWVKFQKFLENLPEITLGYQAYRKQPFPLPTPIQKKQFEFVANKEDWGKLQQALKHGGPHHLKSFKQIAAPVKPESYGRPPGKPNEGQLALLLSSGIMEAIEIEHNGKRGLMRGSTKRKYELFKKEVKQDSKGNDFESEIWYDKPYSYITVLTEDGNLHVIEPDKLVDFIIKHRQKLVDYVMRVFKPKYDMKIDPLWKETYKTYRVEGKHEMYPAQKHVATALTEHLLNNLYAIAACEMRFGKTPITISIIENLVKVEELKRDNPEALSSILSRNEMKLKDIRGIKPGEVVLVVAPANMPENWIKAITTMYPKANVRRLTNVFNTARFFEEADQNRSELYIGVTTFENIKLGESWSGAWFEKRKYELGIVYDDNNMPRKELLTKKYANCPTTGEPIAVKVGKDWVRATPKDLDNKITKVGQRFFAGEVFDGYEQVPIPHGENAGKLQQVPVNKRINRNNGYALFQDERRFGLPTVGNGHVLTEEYEVEIPAKTGKMLKKDPWKKNWFLKEYTTKPNVIQGVKVVKNLVPDEELLDPWLARQGIRVYAKSERNREIDKHMKKMGYDEYTIGDGDEEMDVLLKRHKIDTYYLEPGKKIFRNPRYPLSEFIKRKYKGRIGLLVVDELHAMQGSSTDIGVAIRNLCYCANRTLGLTGTLYGGTASSIYTILFTFNPEVRTRYPWMDGNVMHWVRDMGVLKEVKELKNEYVNGVMTGNKRYTTPIISEAAGYSPEMFKLMMPNTVFAGLRDLGGAIPPYEERPEIVDMSPEQEVVYAAVYNASKDYLNRCLLNGDGSYLAAHYQGLFRLPDSMFRENEFIHRIKMDKRSKTEKAQEIKVLTSPSLGEGLMPKEEKLIERINAMLKDNRKCIVHVSQTGTRDIQPRLMEIIKSGIEEAKPFILKSSTVQAAERSGYIAKKLESGFNIMICHPALIKEGVDMSAFSYTAFIEIEPQLRLMAQASKRTWGLSQKRADGVTVEYYSYNDVFQQSMLQTIASKTAAADVIYGHESGALGEMSEDVDLLDDLKAIIRGGSEEELRKKLMSKEEIAESFSRIVYTQSDLKRSSWYAEEEEEDEQQLESVFV